MGVGFTLNDQRRPVGGVSFAPLLPITTAKFFAGGPADRPIPRNRPPGHARHTGFLKPPFLHTSGDFRAYHLW